MRSGQKTWLHNHPSGLIGGGFSFSYGDLRNFCNGLRYQTSIVVEGETVYVLTASMGRPTVDELNEFLRLRFEMDFESPDGVVSAAHASRLVQDGYLILMGDGIGFTSKMISEIADYFDLDYTVSEISEFFATIYTPACPDIEFATVSGHLAAPEPED